MRVLADGQPAVEVRTILLYAPPTQQARATLQRMLTDVVCTVPAVRHVAFRHRPSRDDILVTARAQGLCKLR